MNDKKTKTLKTGEQKVTSVATNNLSPSAKPSSLLTSKAVLIMGILLAVSALALTFIGGFAVGKKSAAGQVQKAELRHRQLTQNLDRPIKDRPLLKNLSDNAKTKLKQHGIAGQVVETSSDALVVDTPEGARSVLINEQTKIVDGKSKEPLDRSALKAGVRVLVLSQPDQNSQSDNVVAKVIIIGGDKPQPGNKPQQKKDDRAPGFPGL